MRTWLRVLVAAGAVTTACTTAAPAPTPRTGPTVAQNEVVQRIQDYAAGVESEVPGLEGLVATVSPLSTLTCDGGDGTVATVRYRLPATEADPGPALRRWMAARGFRPVPVPTSTPVPGADRPTSAGRAPDGVTLALEPALPGRQHGALVFFGPCSWPASRKGGPTGTGLPPSTAPRGPVRTAVAVCERPGASVLAGAARFAGPGPHPVAVGDVTVAGEPYRPGHYLPPGWTAVRSGVQLVACVQTGQTSFTGRTVQCRFDLPLPSTIGFQVHRATYRVTVLEAATGRRVTGFTVPSRPGPDERGCPSTVEDRRGVHALTERIDGDRFEAVLGPLVLRPR